MKRDEPSLKSVLEVMAATAAWCALHSALASDTSKNIVSAQFGERARSGWYRGFYIVASLASFGALVLFILKRPDRKLYEARGLPKMLMHAGQLFALWQLLGGAKRIGFLRMAGATNILQFLRGDEKILLEPEAQGPASTSMQAALDGDETTELQADGPFKTSRHPLNFWQIPVFWLMPKMSVNLAAFSCVASVYLWLGSFHEAARLRRQLGKLYEDYETSGVPFFVPRFFRKDSK